MYTDNRDAGGPAEKPVARGARRMSKCGRKRPINHKSKKEALMKTLWKLVCFILKLAAALAALSALAQWLSCGYESHRSRYVVDRELTEEEE